MTGRRLTVAELRAADPDTLPEWQRGWRAWFLTQPDVLACYGYSNGYTPPARWIAVAESLATETEQEQP